MRVSVAAAAVCGAFALTGLALGAASFSDTSDDNNAAPDITSLQVSEAPDGVVTIVLSVRNYATLPLDTWFDVWFDDDSDQATGFVGDETLVRYSSNGAVELFEWDGLVMVRRPAPAGTTGSFANGALTLTVPKEALGGDSAFGIAAVAVRRQVLIVARFHSTDLAPDRDRFEYTGPAQATFTDIGNDEDAAPDITGTRVTDTKDGWISFSVTTPNYATLTDESVLIVAIDSDNRAALSDIDSAVELRVTYFRGEAFLERWEPRNGGWVQDSQPGLVRARNSGSVVTVDLRRSAFGKTQRFGFALTAMDLDGAVGTIRALDQAPDSGGFFRYAFANQPALVLVAARISTTPSTPRAGQPFAVQLPVRRSDTSRGITSGRVTCTAKLRGKPLTGRGSVVGGAGRCSFAIPRAAAGARLQGRITVRVADASVAAGFAYVVR
jgi:hypothetical protein